MFAHTDGDFIFEPPHLLSEHCNPEGRKQSSEINAIFRFMMIDEQSVEHIII